MNKNEIKKNWMLLIMRLRENAWNAFKLVVVVVVLLIIIIGSISMEINSKTWLGTSQKYHAINTTCQLNFLSLLLLFFYSHYYYCMCIPCSLHRKNSQIFLLLHLFWNIGYVMPKALNNKNLKEEQSIPTTKKFEREKRIKLLIYHK